MKDYVLSFLLWILCHFPDLSVFVYADSSCPHFFYCLCKKNIFGAFVATQDPRGQSSVWQLRSMVETMGDPFHYFEAECVEGPRVKFETGEFLCMIEPISKKVKAVAIVNHQDRNQAPLLRSRIPRDCSISKVL